MGWQERDYASERRGRELLRSDFVRATVARGLAAIALLAPLGALAGLAAMLGPDWLTNGAGATQAIAAGALGGALYGAVAALAAFVELWLEAHPLVGTERELVGAAIVFGVGFAALWLLLPQVGYALAVAQGAPPLEELSRTVRGTAPSFALEWLRSPSTLCALASPLGALTAVRGADDERPLSREVALVAGAAAGCALLIGLTFGIMSFPGSIVGGFPTLGLALRVTVVPATGGLLSVAAHLADGIDARVERALHGPRD